MLVFVVIVFSLCIVDILKFAPREIILPEDQVHSMSAPEDSGSGKGSCGIDSSTRSHAY